jgi:hypothetical protein
MCVPFSIRSRRAGHPGETLILPDSGAPLRISRDDPLDPGAAMAGYRGASQMVYQMPTSPQALPAGSAPTDPVYWFRIDPPGKALRPAGFDSPGTTISVLVVWQSMHRTLPFCGW